MSLTIVDLQAIREIVKDEVHATVNSTVKEELRTILGELETLSNDSKEIIRCEFWITKKSPQDSQFQTLSLEVKLLKLNTELLAAAKQTGITLPR